MFISHLFNAVLFFRVMIDCDFVEFYTFLFAVDDHRFAGMKEQVPGTMPADAFPGFYVFFADDQHASGGVISHVLVFLE
jgi:hypothetical protein